MTMAHVKFPTIIGLIVLVGGFIAAFVLTRQQQLVGSRAALAVPPPEKVFISNISDRSFTVSWVTSSPTEGFILLEKNGQSLRVIDQRDRQTTSPIPSTTHYVTADDVEPQTRYVFRIGGGIETLFGQPGQGDNPYEVTTGPTLSEAPSPDLAQGIVTTMMNEPAHGAIVYATPPGGQIVSSLVTSSGNWMIPLSMVRQSDLTQWLSYDRNMTMYTLNVEGGNEGISEAIVTTAGDRPVPPIVLGQTYDFRQGKSPVPLPTRIRANATVTPRVSPTDTPGESAFSLDPLGQVKIPEADVALENPARDGETLRATNPEFFGQGPSGLSLEIIVESSQPTTARVTIPQSGRWTFNLPRNLPIGEHQITLKWKDAEGTMQALTRSFIVYATTDDPAFTATGSATPTLTIPTPTPTTMATPTPPAGGSPTPTVSPSATATPFPVPTTGRTSVPDEETPQPDSGSLTPSLALLIMGSMSVLIGLMFTKRSLSHG